MKKALDWGRTDYEDAFTLQKILVDERIAGNVPDTLIFTEHNPVFTMGTRKESEDNLLWDEETLNENNVIIAKTNRGGDITYHGPGQIVGYPILSLQDKKDLHLYLRNLEQVLINALGSLGLATHRNPGKTGIWIENRKIAAIGVAVKRWVTYHGFALNVNPDLSHFEGIVPCGISRKECGVTSIAKELGNIKGSLDLDEVKHIIELEFWKIF